MTNHNMDMSKYQDKKVRVLMLAESLRRLGEVDRAIRVSQCGSYLGFVKLSDGKKALIEANFCRERLCPMCGWRRSLRIFQATSKILDYIDSQQQDSVKYLFLTLTVRNCPGSELTATLDTMSESWNRMKANKAWQRRVLGAMRTLEITYNRKTDTYHPHYHMILAVPKDYGKSGDKLYWDHDAWVSVWKKSARLDYSPIVSIEQVKGSRAKGIAEVSKYAVKSTDMLISGDDDATDRVVGTLLEHLRGRRLVAYTGLFRKAQKALKIADPEEGELTDSIRGDIFNLIVRYRWSAGLGCYVPNGEGTTRERNQPMALIEM